MLRSNHKGMFLLDTLFSFSLLLFLSLSLIPVLHLLTKQQIALETERAMSRELHNELIKTIPYPSSHERSLTINGVEAIIRMEDEGELLKGCMIWEDLRSGGERMLCLYAAPIKMPEDSQ